MAARAIIPTTIACAWFLMFTAYAQEAKVMSELVDCSGLVQPSESGASAIELDGDGGGFYRAELDGSGYFRLGRIPPGAYRARILDSNGERLETVSVYLERGMPLLVLHVPQVRHAAPNHDTISVAVLQHKVPAKARRELELATRANNKKDKAGAIGHLQKAVSLDPEFMEAHNSLGIRYVETGRDDLALVEFRKALEMDPRHSAVQANVAAVLLRLRRPAEAETAARRSVELDGSNLRARFLLAMAILNQGRFTPEVEKDLRQATSEVGSAHLILGTVLIAEGREQEGAVELKAYLTTGLVNGRAEAEAWLNKLNQKRESGDCEAAHDVDAGAGCTATADKH